MTETKTPPNSADDPLAEYDIKPAPSAPAVDLDLDADGNPVSAESTPPASPSSAAPEASPATDSAPPADSGKQPEPELSAEKQKIKEFSDRFDFFAKVFYERDYYPVNSERPREVKQAIFKLSPQRSRFLSFLFKSDGSLTPEETKELKKSDDALKDLEAELYPLVKQYEKTYSKESSALKKALPAVFKANPALAAKLAPPPENTPVPGGNEQTEKTDAIAASPSVAPPAVAADIGVTAPTPAPPTPGAASNRPSVRNARNGASGSARQNEAAATADDDQSSIDRIEELNKIHDQYKQIKSAVIDLVGSLPSDLKKQINSLHTDLLQFYKTAGESSEDQFKVKFAALNKQAQLILGELGQLEKFIKSTRGSETDDTDHEAKEEELKVGPIIRETAIILASPRDLSGSAKTNLQNLVKQRLVSIGQKADEATVAKFTDKVMAGLKAWVDQDRTRVVSAECSKLSANILDADFLQEKFWNWAPNLVSFSAAVVGGSLALGAGPGAAAAWGGGVALARGFLKYREKFKTKRWEKMVFHRGRHEKTLKSKAKELSGHSQVLDKVKDLWHNPKGESRSDAALELMFREWTAPENLGQNDAFALLRAAQKTETLRLAHEQLDIPPNEAVRMQEILTDARLNQAMTDLTKELGEQAAAFKANLAAYNTNEATQQPGDRSTDLRLRGDDGKIKKRGTEVLEKLILPVGVAGLSALGSHLKWGADLIAPAIAAVDGLTSPSAQGEFDRRVKQELARNQQDLNESQTLLNKIAKQEFSSDDDNRKIDELRVNFRARLNSKVLASQIDIEFQTRAVLRQLDLLFLRDVCRDLSGLSARADGERNPELDHVIESLAGYLNDHNQKVSDVQLKIKELFDNLEKTSVTQKIINTLSGALAGGLGTPTALTSWKMIFSGKVLETFMGLGAAAALGAEAILPNVAGQIGLGKWQKGRSKTDLKTPNEEEASPETIKAAENREASEHLRALNFCDLYFSTKLEPELPGWRHPIDKLWKGPKLKTQKDLRSQTSLDLSIELDQCRINSVDHGVIGKVLDIVQQNSEISKEKLNTFLTNLSKNPNLSADLITKINQVYWGSVKSSDENTVGAWLELLSNISRNSNQPESVRNILRDTKNIFEKGSYDSALVQQITSSVLWRTVFPPVILPTRPTRRSYSENEEDEHLPSAPSPWSLPDFDSNLALPSDDSQLIASANPPFRRRISRDLSHETPDEPQTDSFTSELESAAAEFDRQFGSPSTPAPEALTPSAPATPAPADRVGGPVSSADAAPRKTKIDLSKLEINFDNGQTDLGGEAGIVSVKIKNAACYYYQYLEQNKCGVIEYMILQKEMPEARIFLFESNGRFSGYSVIEQPEGSGLISPSSYLASQSSESLKELIETLKTELEQKISSATNTATPPSTPPSAPAAPPSPTSGDTPPSPSPTPDRSDGVGSTGSEAKKPAEISTIDLSKLEIKDGKINLGANTSVAVDDIESTTVTYDYNKKYKLALLHFQCNSPLIDAVYMVFYRDGNSFYGYNIIKKKDEKLPKVDKKLAKPFSALSLLISELKKEIGDLLVQSEPANSDLGAQPAASRTTSAPSPEQRDDSKISELLSDFKKSFSNEHQAVVKQKIQSLNPAQRQELVMELDQNFSSYKVLNIGWFLRDFSGLNNVEMSVLVSLFKKFLGSDVSDKNKANIISCLNCDRLKQEIDSDNTEVLGLFNLDLYSSKEIKQAVRDLFLRLPSQRQKISNYLNTQNLQEIESENFPPEPAPTLVSPVTTSPSQPSVKISTPPPLPGTIISPATPSPAPDNGSASPAVPSAPAPAVGSGVETNPKPAEIDLSKLEIVDGKMDLGEAGIVDLRIPGLSEPTYELRRQNSMIFINYRHGNKLTFISVSCLGLNNNYNYRGSIRENNKLFSDPSLFLLLTKLRDELATNVSGSGEEAKTPVDQSGAATKSAAVSVEAGAKSSSASVLESPPQPVDQVSAKAQATSVVDPDPKEDAPASPGRRSFLKSALWAAGALALGGGAYGKHEYDRQKDEELIASLSVDDRLLLATDRKLTKPYTVDQIKEYEDTIDQVKPVLDSKQIDDLCLATIEEVLSRRKQDFLIRPTDQGGAYVAIARNSVDSLGSFFFVDYIRIIKENIRNLGLNNRDTKNIIKLVCLLDDMDNERIEIGGDQVIWFKKIPLLSLE